jgi:Flp pilus assembly protein TadD
MTGRRWTLAAVALILLGVFWTSVWQGMDRSVLSRAPILDEAHYLEKAVEIREQGWLPDQPFTMSPLYSYLVAATGSGRSIDQFRLRAGTPPSGIRWLQALLWTGIAWILWRVASQAYGPRWSWIPPLLWMAYAPTVILAGQVLLEVPLTFAATVALAVASGQIGPKSHRNRALIAGAMVGMAFLLRGTSIVLVVPVVMALLPDRSPRSWRATTVPMLLALAVVVLPFVALNSARTGKLVPPALNGGVNLYIGNGSGANGLFRAFQGYDLESDPSGAKYLSQKYQRDIPDAWSANKVWTDEARAEMAANPTRVLGLWARKVRLHFVGADIPQISAFTAWERHVPLLKGLVVPWALLAAAGLAGGVLAWRRQRFLQPWLLAAVILIAVQSLFFVVTRYRIILVPTLALAATACLREIVIRRGRGLVQAVLIGALAVACVWPWGLGATLKQFEAGGLDNEAIRWEHAASSLTTSNPAAADRDLLEAEALYRQSLSLSDQRYQPWQGLARVLWFRGQQDQAVELLAEGLGRVTMQQDLRTDLIAMLLQQGQAAEALPHLDIALRDQPDDAKLLHNMTIALASTGRVEQASNTAQQLIAVHPDDPRGYLDLGVMLGRAGRFQDASDVFSHGLQQVPDHPELTRNLTHVRQLIADPEK